MQRIIHYFPDLKPLQKEQLLALKPLYDWWNVQINLISRKDMDNFYLHHVLHSLSLAKLLSLHAHSNVLDVGTGGGFPGIPLAIYFPEVHFTLVDSVAKKMKAVRDIVEQIGLKNVQTCCTRVENLQGSYDFITGRAVASISTFYHWVKDKIRKENNHMLPNGVLYMKGGQNAVEASLKVQYALYPLQDFFSESFFETKYIVHLYPS